MLKGNFFHIELINITADELQATLKINEAHAILEGHFPGQPVVPGVCMMQMIKELLEEAIQLPTRITQSDYLKFLSVINPLADPLINARLKFTKQEDGSYAVNATLFKEERVFLKMQGLFVMEV
jgi:3-hydroxyacyl-[acyl-carrier-protein] dehydratase